MRFNYPPDNAITDLEHEPLPDEIPAVEQLIADHKEFMENTARRQPEVDRACKPKAPPAGVKEAAARKPSRQLKTPVYVVIYLCLLILPDFVYLSAPLHLCLSMSHVSEFVCFGAHKSKQKICSPYCPPFQKQPFIPQTISLLLFAPVCMILFPIHHIFVYISFNL